MNIVKNWGVLLVIAGVLSGCGPEHDHKGKTPLVEVAGEYLYKEDLQAALPFNISKDDSVLFAEHYIRNWVEDVLLFDKAEGNIPDNAKIAKLVENYRRALIMHTYQEELVNQKLANEISDEEISAYYEKNKELFHTEHPFVKTMAHTAWNPEIPCCFRPEISQQGILRRQTFGNRNCTWKLCRRKGTGIVETHACPMA